VSCTCGHPHRRHRGSDHDEACNVEGCKCPWYCTPEEADDIITTSYQRALADNEPWAIEAYEARQALHAESEDQP
jgi:hypothetical protein